MELAPLALVFQPIANAPAQLAIVEYHAVIEPDIVKIELLSFVIPIPIFPKT